MFFRRVCPGSFVHPDHDKAAVAAPFPDRIHGIHPARVPEDRLAEGEGMKSGIWKESGDLLVAGVFLPAIRPARKTQGT